MGDPQQQLVAQYDPLRMSRRRFRSVHLAEDTPYKFAVILATELPKEHALPEPVPEIVVQHESVVRSLTEAGLDVTVLQGTVETAKKVVLLINATKRRLLQEWKLLRAEREAFENVDEIMEMERVYEGGGDLLDGVDDIQSDRPAWNRDDPEKGKIALDNYESTKWEAERDLSYADEIVCIKRIIQNSPNPSVGSSDLVESLSHSSPGAVAKFKGAGINIQREKKDQRFPIVEAVFPLHDDKFATEFVSLLAPAEELKTTRLFGETWFVEELRYHFGERLAYYFAFQQMYTAWLKPIALVGLFFWLLFCVFGPSAVVYWRIIAIYGLLISTLWAPAMLRYWTQRTQELNKRWHLDNWSDELDPNPRFDWGKDRENKVVVREEIDAVKVRQTFFRFADPELMLMDREQFANICKVMPGLQAYDDPEAQASKFNELDKDGRGLVDAGTFVDWVASDPGVNTVLGVRPFNPPFHRWWNVPINLFVLFIFTIIFFVLNLGFVYWYVYGVLVDTCEEGDTRSWPQCFNTDSGTLLSGRWCYLALQGIALGIFLDIILEGLVTSLVARHADVKNHTTIKAQEDYYVSNVFFYLWMGWFMWFGLLGFVYIPFGSWIQKSQQAILGEDLVNDWVPGRIAMDTAMVTPLIVTQLLKVLTDTFIPFLTRRLTEKARLQKSGPLDMGRRIAAADIDEFRDHLAELDDAAGSGGGSGESDKLLSKVDTTPNPTYELLVRLRDGGDLAKQVSVTPSLPSWEYDETEEKMVRAWKTATHIVEESQRGDFNMFSEMLRPVIQFSYVTNFSAAWPLTALCAYINNLFEVKGDAFKMLVGQRRSVPRQVNGLGSWEGCLLFSAVAGVFFMVGMIVVATNGLESFIAPRECDLSDNDWIMRPNVGCMDSSGTSRVVALLVMEHTCLLIFFFVYYGIPATSEWVRQGAVRRHMRLRRRFEDHWLLRDDGAAKHP